MSTDRARLAPADVSQRLTAHPAWAEDEAHLVREWEFADFDAAMVFINRVADVARELDHHPDLYNVYNRVRLRVTTHDAGGLTALDFRFATLVDGLES